MDKFEFTPDLIENKNETIEIKIGRLLDAGYSLQDLFSELCLSDLPLFEDFSIKKNSITLFLKEYPGVLFFESPFKIKREVLTFFDILGLENMRLVKMNSIDKKYSFTFSL